MKDRLVSDTNLKGDVTINNLEILALLTQIHLFAPKMQHLAHIHTTVDNADGKGWYNRGSNSLAMAVGPILWDLNLLTRGIQIYASVGRIKGAYNTMADAASRLTYLTNRMFLRHFALTLPQKNPWQLLPLPSKCKRRMTSMLQIKHYHMDFQPHSTRRTPLYGTNGAHF